jgi:hypothetical protein
MKSIRPDFDEIYQRSREGYNSLAQQPGLVADAGGQPAAIFTLNITRVTASIAQPLPFVLFGQQLLQSQYAELVNPVLTGGTVFDGVTGGNPGAIADAEKKIFSFTNGGDTDTIEVTSQDGSAYPQLLNGSAIVPMQVNKMRLSLSDETKLLQFSQSLKIGNQSLFGKSTNQSLTPSSSKSPNQQQAGIIDLLSYPVALGASVFMQSKMIAEQGLVLSITFEVSSFSRPLQAG